MKKEVKIVIAVVVVLALALVVYFASKTTMAPGGQFGSGDVPAGVPEEMLENQTPEAAEATQALINEVGDSEENVQTITVPGEPTLSETGENIITAEEIKVVVVAPGTSGINTKTGVVVNPQGEEVKNDAEAATGAAPQSSFPIDPADAPGSAIKLQVTSSSFTPNEFTVNRGQAVSLVISNVNETTFSEVFRFDDPSLSAVVIGLAKGETKSITFNAPTESGEYTFYSAMFNHRETGAVGKMIVR